MNSIKPFWEEKVWGRVLHCFASPYASVSYLEVKAGTRCSRHYHAERVNQFVVLSGSICIEEFDKTDAHKLTDRIILTPKVGPYNVPPLCSHRFRVLRNGQVIEVYYPEHSWDQVRMDDIVRYDEGSPDDLAGLLSELRQEGHHV